MRKCCWWIDWGRLRDFGKLNKTMLELVQELESRLGFTLPHDYRQFLIGHRDQNLEHSLLFKSPRPGVIDLLLTAQEILLNDDERKIGIPEKSLMHIGGNLFGGYLYLDVSMSRFGQVCYMENYVFTEHFPSFTTFLAETEEEIDR